MVDIMSADLTRYNANNRGTSTGDCVKRAISFAFDESYIKIGQELNAKMKELRSESYKYSRVYNQVIKAHGGSDPTKPDRPDYTLGEWVDEHPSGVYLVTTGDKPSSHNHIVAVVNGTVYDSWDSRDKFVHTYYTINREHKEITNIMEDHKFELCDLAVNTMINVSKKLRSKYEWGTACRYSVDSFPYVKNFAITIDSTLSFRSATGYLELDMPVVFVLTPTMTLEEAEKTIASTAKVRLYDRFYAANQKYEKAKEEAAVKAECEANGHTIKDKGFWSSSEQKFYESLPGWVKGSCDLIRIDQPGQYSDSYTLALYPLSNHPVERDWLDYKERIRFEAYTASDMKDMLNRYYKNNEVPYRDYDPHDEY